MKNIVSFETARALKEAGFPQPEPEWGQFWYNRHEMCCFCEKKSMEPEGMVFAPTATDILEQLPSQYKLSNPFGGFWMCENVMDEEDWFEANNPAEAAAAAWLALKKDLEV